jgi:Bacterial PH domain
MVQNSEKYKEYTKNRDWKSICQLNEVDFDTFGTKKEFSVLHNHLEDDEVIFAFCSGIVKGGANTNLFDRGVNTWIVLLTSERILFLDHALITRSIDKRTIRLDKIQSVSSSQGWVLGKIMFDIGSGYVEVDNCEKKSVAIFSDMANKILRERENKITEVGVTGDNLIVQLERLANLKAVGMLDDEEFRSAKSKLLSN